MLPFLFLVFKSLDLITRQITFVYKNIRNILSLLGLGVRHLDQRLLNWRGGTGIGEGGGGGGGVEGPTIPLLSINFLQIPVSLSLGARGFFFSFRDDRILRQSREGATSNSALGSLSLSREGESEKTSSIQAKCPFDSKKSI